MGAQSGCIWCRIFLIIVSLLLIAAGTALYFFFPKLMKQEVSSHIVLKESSDIFGAWSKSPVPITTKIYFFNVENAKQVLQGEKAVLREVGPFTFK